MRIGWSIATLLAFLAVVACTLFPFHFSVSNHPHRSVSDVLLIGIGPDKGLDILSNVLLFLAFGFTLTGYLDHKRIRPLASMTAVLLGSFCLSYAIEVLQLFMPGRFTSVIDVLSNTAGGALGFLCYRLSYRATNTIPNPQPGKMLPDD